MHLFLLILSSLSITCASAMSETDYDPSHLPLPPHGFWMTAQEWATQESCICQLRTVISSLESEHAVSNATHAIQLLKKNTFHEAIFLWAVSKGYNLATIRKIGTVMRKKIADDIFSPKQFERLVALHRTYPLNREQVDEKIVSYINRLCENDIPHIKKNVTKYLKNPYIKGKIHKHTPAARKIPASNGESHFAVCNAKNGELVLVPQPLITRKKKGDPKKLEEMICLNTDTHANTKRDT